MEKDSLKSKDFTLSEMMNRVVVESQNFRKKDPRLEVLRQFFTKQNRMDIVAKLEQCGLPRYLEVSSDIYDFCKEFMPFDVRLINHPVEPNTVLFYWGNPAQYKPELLYQATPSEVLSGAMGCYKRSPVFDDSVKMRSFEDKIISDLSSERNRLLEEKVIAKLAESGYKFDSREEFLSFVKERCRIEKYPEDDKRIFFVDDKPVFSFCDTLDLEFDGHKLVMVSNGFKIE